MGDERDGDIQIGRPTTRRPDQPRLAPKRPASRRTYVILGVLALFVVLMFAPRSPAPQSGASTPQGSAPATASQTNQARYSVVASCPVDVTMQTADGVSQRRVSPPWTYDRRARRGDFLYLSAQLTCSSGTVSVEILRWQRNEWQRVRRETSSGPYMIAAVDAVY